MNKDDLRIFVVLLLAIISFNACQKEISCESCREDNQPPIARAGADQAITLPLDSVLLDGSTSADPDGTIATYLWTGLSGSDSLSIASPDSAKTTVTGLTEGNYLFELKVTDDGGLSYRDTVQIQVTTAATATCTPNRTAINVKVTPVGTLSKPRISITLATAGTKILFAGGWERFVGYSSWVDIYDYASNTWSTAELSKQRAGMAIATLGTKIFFAGGITNTNDSVTSRVDIYDASTGYWSTAELSQGRMGIAAAAFGDLVFFAGGSVGGGSPSDRVDIYNNATNAWSTISLSEARSNLEATVVGDKIYFAGGVVHTIASQPYVSNRIDVYDGATGNMSIAADLAERKAYFASIAVGNKIFWAGGGNVNVDGFYQASDQVEIRDIGTNLSTYTCLSGLNSHFNAALRGDEIMFYTASTLDGRMVDIYNVVTGMWSVGHLSENMYDVEIISVNNKIYVVKGYDDFPVEHFGMVATLEW